MEQSEVKLWSLLHAPDGPLVSHLDMFARELPEQDFGARAIHVQIRLVARFSLWLMVNSVRLDTLSDGLADRFRRQLKHRESTRLGSRSCLRRLLASLRREGVVVQAPIAPRPKASSIQGIVAAFGEHLRGA